MERMLGYGLKLWHTDLSTVKDKAPEALVLDVFTAAGLPSANGAAHVSPF